MQRIAQSMEQDQQTAGSRKAESMPSMGKKKVGEASTTQLTAALGGGSRIQVSTYFKELLSWDRRHQPISSEGHEHGEN